MLLFAIGLRGYKGTYDVLPHGGVLSGGGVQRHPSGVVRLPEAQQRLDLDNKWGCEGVGETQLRPGAAAHGRAASYGKNTGHL